LEEDVIAQTNKLLDESETEGVVVRLESGQRIKLKSKWYLGTQKLQYAMVERNLIDAVLEGKSDDLKALTADMPVELAKVKWMEDRKRAIRLHAETIVNDFYDANKELDQSEYNKKARKALDKKILFKCAMKKYD